MQGHSESAASECARGLFWMMALLVSTLGCTAPGALATGSVAGASLPPIETIPPDNVLHPEWYDQDGCTTLASGDGDAVCPAPLPSGFSTGPDVPVALGFRGSYYTTAVDGGSPRVIASGTARTRTGTLLMGIVRNESYTAISSVEITITVATPKGDKAVVGTTMLPVVRPGEPAPFAVETSEEVDALRDVAVTRFTAGGLLPRRFIISENWAISYGDRLPASFDPIYADVGSPPYPFVLYGSVTSIEPNAVQNVHALIAWHSSDAVVWISDVMVHRPGQEVSDMAPGSVGPALESVADFLAAVEDPVAGPLLGDADYTIWIYAEH